MNTPSHRPPMRLPRAPATGKQRALKARAAGPELLDVYELTCAVCHRFHICVDGIPYAAYRQQVLLAAVTLLSGSRLDLDDQIVSGGPYAANLARLIADYDQRYEQLRVLLADWLNRAGDADAPGMARCTFDVWIAQRSTAGVYEPTMDVVLVAPPGGELPARELQALLYGAILPGAPPPEALPWLHRIPKASLPLYFASERGVNPIALGAFLDFRVAGGNVRHTWKLSETFLEACSARYRALHQLTSRTRDPYRQVLTGAKEPGDFRWDAEG